jgi:hypothetical protein
MGDGPELPGCKQANGLYGATMKPELVHSLSELVALAVRDLDAGKAIGEVHAVLTVDGGDPVCVQAIRSQGTEGTDPVIVQRMNGVPIRAKALDLLLVIHGATLLPADRST